jgi:glycosyltransferase 2 family protein
LLRPLAPSLDAPHAIGVGLLGYLAALAAPFRLGEFVRPLLIARTRVVGFLEALGSIVAERVVDGLTISVWAAIGLQLTEPVSPLPDHLGDVRLPVAAAPKVVMLGPVVFGIALISMSVLWLARGFVLATLPPLLDRISTRLTAIATGLVTRLTQGFGTLREGFGVGFTLDNLLFWGTLVLAHWTLLRGLGFDATLSQAGVMIGLQALGSLLPAGPGQFGAFQLSGYIGLVLYFPTTQVLTDGALVVFLSYASQIGAHLIGGVLGLWLVRRAPTRAELPSPS